MPKTDTIDNLQITVTETPMPQTYTIDNWQITVAETQGNGLRADIKSPAGREASCDMIGFDHRLTQHRTQANIEFASHHLKLTDALVDRIAEACRLYAQEQAALEPEFALDKI